MIERFEKETGVKVKMSYFQAAPEILEKVRSGEVYDVIVPGGTLLGNFIDVLGVTQSTSGR